MICRYCGQEVRDGVRFCNHCGANLGAEAPAYGGTVQNGGTAPQPMPVPVQYQGKEYKKTNKLLVVLLILIPVMILAAIIVPAVIGYSSDIRRVKNGTIDAPGYDDKQWGEVLSDICYDSDWTQYKEDGERFVKYTGEKKSNGNDLEIIFKMTSDRKNFTIESITDGEVEITNKMAVSLAAVEMFDGVYK